MSDDHKVDMSQVRVEGEGPLMGPPKNSIDGPGGIVFQQVTVREFAESVKEFYEILLELKMDPEFAKQLTVAFVRRP